MLHPDIVPGISRHGSGLFAARDIPVGAVVWGPCPSCTRLRRAALRTLPEPSAAWLDEHGYWCRDGSLILPCGHAHLMNHSCAANVLDAGLAVGIAVRAISRGSEVTCDYRTFRYDPPWSFVCACGKPQCAGSVRSASLGMPAGLEETWARRVAAALRKAPAAPQPLGMGVLSHGDITEPVRRQR
ncbi:SET domain-containing protein [Parafrankia irregularis]|uniref:SET domain-containing protein n=1 Tax=Parafrankia irregularis TaxID=795642 RepID=A0A0S4QVT6_9ACTN|nr:SET domain-containing protein [Parafrankia irregularis]